MADASPSSNGVVTEGDGTAGAIESVPEVQKGSPNDFLKHVIGKPVVVRLNSGVDYHGILTCLDGYMNIALEDTTEWVEGRQRNAYGDAFVRGNNVLYITAA
ncbi:Sm-like ribonucleo protein [Ceraceosorus guamensis]|uniref:U6 snRNA-associated Sm-like protein LSm6 n=1 Tax=Ceraceosorus guamensis TaxID=1522189 RepID=A0A316VRH2_9BASI|nr:Sm-like ribonucleo protein [Ceraceosorus guamensis]PWN39003.1 Sm-like ribonucleo protein [Ceraceosorus guamensis]